MLLRRTVLPLPDPSASTDTRVQLEFQSAQLTRVTTLFIPKEQPKPSNKPAASRAPALREGKFIWQGVVGGNTKAGTWAARRVA